MTGSISYRYGLTECKINEHIRTKQTAAWGTDNESLFMCKVDNLTSV
jgi:hypothetical protein